MPNFNNRPRPYVGVSGVVSPDMQGKLEKAATDAGLFNTGRLLALGVKAVHKTQYLDTENKYGPEWYPVGEDNFSHALRHDHSNADTIAVAQTYLDVDHVADPEYRRQFIARIAQRGLPWMQAIQFDMLPWHNDPQMLSFLEEIKTEYGLTVFLQCHNDAMTELGPEGVVLRLGDYASYIDYLLFDSSHGTGTRLDATRLDSFLETASVSDRLAHTGLAVAGGLNETIVREDMPPLIAKYPNLSWDAEGQLHPVNDVGKRPLDLEIASRYLAASAQVIASV